MIHECRIIVTKALIKSQIVRNIFLPATAFICHAWIVFTPKYWHILKEHYSIFPIKSISHTCASFGATKAIKLIGLIFESFYKDIYYSPKFHCQIIAMSLQRWRAFQFLTIFKKSLLQHLLNHRCHGVRQACFPKVAWSMLEDTSVTTNFLKNHICNTSGIEINAWYATFNNKELGNVKVRLKLIAYLKKRWWLMENLFKYKCYEVVYANLVFHYSREFRIVFHYSRS